VIAVVLVLACARHPESHVPPGHLTVLHTNDIHGHFLPEPADWLEGRPAIGGFVRLEQEVRAERAENGADAVLLLDGGDLLTGTPLTDAEEDGCRGCAMWAFLGPLGYDAWAVGNHEFDKRIANLAKFTAASSATPLSANLRTADGVDPLLPRQRFSRVFKRNGVRIGVIGATTEGLKTLMNRDDYATLKLIPVADAVRAEVNALDPATDLIVVVSHIGVEGDMDLARAVPGIDLIVGGHSHTRLEQAQQVQKTWVVQAGSYNRSLGVVDLEVAGDEVSAFHYELRHLRPESARVEPDPGLVQLSADWQARIEASYGEIVATAPVLLGRDHHHECALGRWITDVLRESAGADIGLYNAGGLRADVAAGPVTRRALFEAFPFGNEVFRFELTGEEVWGILLKNTVAEAEEKRGFVSISGVKYTWRLVNGAPEITGAWVGGRPLDRAATYSVASNSYVTEQWEKHLGAKPRNAASLGYTDFEAAVEHARAKGVADPAEPRAVRE
jgi:2',3'-cyclic-nucleotide 2'-phosphodiesterase (5'-nucleotidase family)